MIETLHLFRPLNEKLMELLKQLSEAEWNKRTVAGHWTVKDVVAHLLDGNIRCIALFRDKYSPGQADELHTYDDIVKYLNRINGEWVTAMRQLSERQLTEWLSQTHEEYIKELEHLNPLAQAPFSVAWAGDKVSLNWFHVAREFTEKWHHQQQISHAVEKPGILTREFYWPVLDTFMQALPHHYRNVKAPVGTCLQITIDSEAGGSWLLEKQDEGWILRTHFNQPCKASIVIPVDISWRLFTKAVLSAADLNEISISGKAKLIQPVLSMVTVMA